MSGVREVDVGGGGGGGGIVISAGPEAVRHPVGSVRTPQLVEALRRPTQLRRPVSKLICGWATPPYVHQTSIT